MARFIAAPRIPKGAADPLMRARTRKVNTPPSTVSLSSLPGWDATPEPGLTGIYDYGDPRTGAWVGARHTYADGSVKNFGALRQTQSVGGPLGFVLDKARDAYDWQQNLNRQRNQQMFQAHQFRQQGISPMDALALSRITAYQDYNSDPIVQANLLALMKAMGYVPQQAL